MHYVSCGVAVCKEKFLIAIFSTGDPRCPYGAPSVSAWAAVAVAVTSPSLPISPSSGYTAIGLGLLSVLTLVIRVSHLPVSNQVRLILMPFFSEFLRTKEVLGICAKLECHRPCLCHSPGSLLDCYGLWIHVQLLLASEESGII